ncbi:hypothetical protein R6G78_09230, partial [Actinotignum timonense]|uniref:hypothetical protein n=1 Tax=Actinotignum timonense TaxID=1870995 RepID=UPI002A823E33
AAGYRRAWHPGTGPAHAPLRSAGAGVAAVAPWWAAALGAVVAVLCGFALGWWARRRSAAARARAYQRAVNKELSAVVEKHCVAPAREVLDQYARVRQVVRGE